MPANRPPVIRDQDRVDFRLTEEAEYRIPFTFIEALNEGTLADRPAHAFLNAARERRLFHVLNLTTDNIIGTGVIQMASGSTQEAEVGGLLFHPRARGFGLAALLVKIMMIYAIKESGRDSPEEEYPIRSSRRYSPNNRRFLTRYSARPPLHVAPVAAAPALVTQPMKTEG